MATKKQKRLEGEARAIQQAEQTRISGLKALERDREHRAIKAREAQEAEERELAKVRRQKKASGFTDLNRPTNPAIIAFIAMNNILQEDAHNEHN